MKEKNIPICLYSSLENDKKILNEIVDSGIKCKFFGPLLIKDSPIVFFESMDFYGLSGIRAFIKRYKIFNNIKKEA